VVPAVLALVLWISLHRVDQVIVRPVARRGDRSVAAVVFAGSAAAVVGMLEDVGSLEGGSAVGGKRDVLAAVVAVDGMQPGEVEVEVADAVVDGLGSVCTVVDTARIVVETAELPVA
jgi:fumarate reductase subunit D